MNVLRAFNAKATMRDINRDFCLAFINFLRNIYVSPSGKKLSQFTCVSYFGCFRGALNAAVREEIIAENPVNRLNTDEKIKMPESKREFLTIDEVKILIGTPCRREDVKGAFLFSCYCGLRISDVLVLKWKMWIVPLNSGASISSCRNPSASLSSPFHECKEMDAGAERSRR